MRPGEVYAEFTASDGSNVVLRAPRSEDLAGLLGFANAFAKEKKTDPSLGVISFDRRLTKAREKVFLDRIVEGIRTNEAVSLVAIVKGDVVGHCAIMRREPEDVRHAGTLGIAILRGYRGLGLGEVMIRTALGKAARLGVWLVELSVFSTNEVALHLYKKVGFKKIGVVPSKMLRRGKLIDEVLMYIDLRGTDKSIEGGRHRS